MAKKKVEVLFLSHMATEWKLTDQIWNQKASMEEMDSHTIYYHIWTISQRASSCLPTTIPFFLVFELWEAYIPSAEFTNTETYLLNEDIMLYDILF